MPIFNYNFETIDNTDNPNQGRDKINRNFAKITGYTDDGNTGTTQVEIPLSNVLVVDSLQGDDSTGLRGYLSKPFQTFSGAVGNMYAGDEIWFMPGTHVITSSMMRTTNVTYRLFGATLNADFNPSSSTDGLLSDSYLGITARTIRIFGDKSSYLKQNNVNGYFCRLAASGSTVEINGINIYDGRTSGSQIGTFRNFVNSHAPCTIKVENCNLVSESNPCFIQGDPANSGTTKISFINTNIFSSKSAVVKRSSNAYFKNCTFSGNSGDNVVVQWNFGGLVNIGPGVGGQPNQWLEPCTVTFDTCRFYDGGNSGTIFISTDPAVGFHQINFVGVNAIFATATGSTGATSFHKRSDSVNSTAITINVFGDIYATNPISGQASGDTINFVFGSFLQNTGITATVLKL